MAADEQSRRMHGKTVISAARTTQLNDASDWER